MSEPAVDAATTAPASEAVPRWYQPGVLVALGVGLVIRMVDLVVIRPTCAGGSNFLESCYRLWGDALGIHGWVNLAARGYGALDPYFFIITGGGKSQLAGKPAGVFAYLVGVSWLGDPEAWRGQLIVGVAAIIVLYAVVDRLRGRRVATLTAQIATALFVALRIFGGTSVTAHRVAGLVLGCAAIPLMAWAGRRLGGPRVGVIAAALTAVYPGIWVNDTMINSEIVAVVVLPLVLGAVFAYRRNPDRIRLVLLGGAVGLAALSRPEYALYLPLVLVPAVYRARGEHGDLPPRFTRVLRVAAGVGVVLATMLPWTAFNAVRFKGQTLTPTTGTGNVLQSGACDEVFYGPGTGWWATCGYRPLETTVRSPAALSQVVDGLVGERGYARLATTDSNPFLHAFEQPPPIDLFEGALDVTQLRDAYFDTVGHLPDGRLGVGIWLDGTPTLDVGQRVHAGQRVRVFFNGAVYGNSGVTDRILGRLATDYIRDNLSRYPVVMAARIGRVLYVFRPAQTRGFEQYEEHRGGLPTWGTMTMWYPLVAGALVGVRVARRRRLMIWPLGSFLCGVILIAAVAHGLPRYRLPLDLAVVLLSSVALDAAFTRWRARTGRTARTPPRDPPPGRTAS